MPRRVEESGMWLNRVNNLIKDPLLVVVDDLDFLESASTFLNSQGYDVEFAPSGREAIVKCIEKYYTIIIVDTELPDFEGPELLNRISDTDPKMRKIVITGVPSVENARKSLNLGADAYLIKPIEMSELLGTVKEQLAEYYEEIAEKYSFKRGK